MFQQSIAAWIGARRAYRGQHRRDRKACDRRPRRTLQIEALEARNLLAGTFTLLLDATTFSNATLVREGPTAVRIFDTDDPANSAHQSTVLDVDFIVVNGGTADNQVTVDYRNGDPLDLVPGGVTFNGGGNAGGGDSLVILGTGTEDAIYTPDASPGTLDQSGVVAIDGGMITFTGLEAVGIVSTSTATLRTPADSNDTLILANSMPFLSPGDALRLSGILRNSAPGATDGVPFAAVDFAGNAQVTIDTSPAGAGSGDDDRVTIVSADNDHQIMNLTIMTGLGDDAVEMNGDLTLSGRGSELRIQSQDITLGGQVRVSDLVVLDAGAGAIVDASPGETANISSLAAALIAANGIGDTDDIDTEIATLSAENRATGLIQISNDRPLVVGAAAGLDGVRGSVNIEVPGSVTVNAPATLAADGTIGGSLDVRGTIAAGPAASVLTSGDLAFQDGAAFDITIGGVAPTGGAGVQHQLLVAGRVTIGSNVSLDATAFDDGTGGPFVPADGDQFVIINNDGVDPVTGTFLGLPEGALFRGDFLGSGANAYLTYAGGVSGNDVVILVDGGPRIGGTVADQAVDDTATIDPFNGVTVTDASAALGVTIRLSGGDANGQLAAAGTFPQARFTQTAAGVYQITDSAGVPIGVSGTEAQTLIRALVFEPTENQTAPGQVVTTTLTIEVDDGTNPIASDAATTVITTSINDPPVANPDVAQLTESVNGLPILNQVAGTVLTNDTDADDPPASLSVTTSGTLAGNFGTLELNADGSYTYTLDDANVTVDALNVGQMLTDTFSYSISDNQATGNSQSSSSRLIVTIHGANDRPTARDNVATVTEDIAPTATGNLITDDDGFGVDSDPDHAQSSLRITGFAFSDTDGAATGHFGTLEWTPDGNYTYTLNPLIHSLVSGETVGEMFLYSLADPLQGDHSGALTVTIHGANDAPVLDGATSFSLPPIAANEVAGAGNQVSEIVLRGGGDPITDLDFGAVEGFAVTGVTGSGTWQYAIDGGTDFTDFGAAQPTAARLLRPQDRMRYLPNPLMDLTAPALPSVSFQAWDQTGGAAGGMVDSTVRGGTTAFSNMAGVATVQVVGTEVARNSAAEPTVIADVVPGGKDDRLAVSIRGANLVIADDSNIIGDAIGGQSGHEVMIPLVSIGPHLVVDLLGGEDTLSFDFRLAPPGFDLSITIKGGDGHDTLTFAGSTPLGAGDVATNDEVEDIFVNTPITTDGNVALDAVQSLEVNADIDAGGEVHLQAGWDVFGNCSAVSATRGRIEGRTGVGGLRVRVTEDLTLTSPAGGISGCDGTVSVTARTATLDAQTSIGAALVAGGAVTTTRPLEMMVGTIDAQAGGIGIFIANQGPLDVARASASYLNPIGTSGFPFGVVDISAVGPLTIVPGPDACAATLNVCGVSLVLTATGGGVAVQEGAGIRGERSITFDGANGKSVRSGEGKGAAGPMIVGPWGTAAGEPEGEANRWHNVRNPFDVNDDGNVAPHDVLTIVNHVNAHGGLALAEGESASGHVRRYVDVNDDGFATPLDALRVVNYLNRAGGAESEGGAVAGLEWILRRDPDPESFSRPNGLRDAASSPARSAAPAAIFPASSAPNVSMRGPSPGPEVLRSQARLPSGFTSPGRLVRASFTSAAERRAADSLDRVLEDMLDEIAEDVTRGLPRVDS